MSPTGTDAVAALITYSSTKHAADMLTGRRTYRCTQKYTPSSNPSLLNTVLYVCVCAYRTKMEEAIRKMQDRLFNKGRKYNELIQVCICAYVQIVCMRACT